MDVGVAVGVGLALREGATVTGEKASLGKGSIFLVSCPVVIVVTKTTERIRAEASRAFKFKTYTSFVKVL